MRKFQAHGHFVGIMMARFVAPYLKSSKNDGNHAETICETVGHPNTRFAPPTKVTVRMLVSNKAGHIDYVTVNAAR